MTTTTDFLERWRNSAAAERANSQLFLTELCDYLGLPRPDPALADLRRNSYVFELPVTQSDGFGESSKGFIDLYKRGCFVLEAKQGGSEPPPKSLFDQDIYQTAKERRGIGIRASAGWDAAMMKARQQAERYAKSLPDEWPPFLITTDVGYSFEVYADFSLTGKAYVPFPDPNTFRILFDHLDRPHVQDRLKAIWLDPLSLDPARRSAKVTVAVAQHLADLAKSLEQTYPDPDRVSAFLMRCIFTFFAEDIRLLREGSFTKLLESLRDDPTKFPPMVESLWQTMNTGGFSPILREHVLKFNGGLFESVEALSINRQQLDLLLLAAYQQWKDVEPAIFGTLLERALNPKERHRLGAHYTPRAYVERLVLPTVIEPLRQEWLDTQAAAFALDRTGKRNDAIDTITAFRRRLCSVTILDPACGSGNFLYVALEHLKRLEGEVNDALDGLGETQQALHETGLTVDPHQLLGIELNPRAAHITDLVLWIGYLQWYFRTWGASSNPPEPVIQRFQNIEHRDALIVHDKKQAALDEDGHPITQWDGVTKVRHPVTGDEVPAEHARRQVWRYPNARRADWPAADYIIGNPPFLGNWRMRGELGDGYVETLRSVYSELPESIDYVMYWWHRAAELVREGSARRFGFITTNSLRQTFQRRVLVPHLTHAKNPASLVFAIPDHPWVDSTDGAAVRIAMTVAEAGSREGLLLRVTKEDTGEQEGAAFVEFMECSGIIHPDLTIGPNTSLAEPLRSNQLICNTGVKLHGAGFIVTPETARSLGLGKLPGLHHHIRRYRNGRDVTGSSRNVMVIDLQGLDIEEVRSRFPEVYQHVLTRVKPERDTNREPSRKQLWWLFGRRNTELRNALSGLRRYIATVETAKHRVFVFLDAAILPDNMLVNIASADGYLLGVLSSRIHVTWALAVGARLGYGNDPRYTKSRCFEPFPFPDPTIALRERIQFLAEQIDAHRKRQQSLHPDLTLTGMYNALEALRAGQALTPLEQKTHEQGLISVLRELHDDLDRAVAEAYGWQADLADEDILFRLVDLNAARAAEERNGLVRWLRPEYQKTTNAQTGLDVEMEEAEVIQPKSKKPAWPTALPDRVRAVRDALHDSRHPATPDAIARRFTRARSADVSAILETLAALGQAQQDTAGAYRP